MSSKFALVIANTEYQDASFAKLTAPGKDAEEFAQVLRDAELAAFDDVQVLINEGEGKTRRAIARFFVNRKRDDLLLLYFSGHGVRNEQGQLFLAANDTEIGILEATGIPAEFVTYTMNNSRSQRQLLILDCCNSGAFAHGSKSVSAVGKSMGIATAFEGSGFGRVVLTATDATQYAWEGDKVIGATQKSVFTHFLIEGLKGDADRDGDGRIHIDELYNYAYEQVVRRTPKQTPGKWSYKQQGDIILRENLKPRDVKPAPLPADLLDLLSHPNSSVRRVGIQDLISLLDGKHLGLARGAQEKLREIAESDDSLTLRKTASDTLITHGIPVEQPAPVEMVEEKQQEEIPNVPVEQKTGLENLSSQAIQYELKGDFWNALQTYYQIKRIDPAFPRVDIKIRELEEELRPEPAASPPPSERVEQAVPLKRAMPVRLIAGIAGGLLIIALCIWGSASLLNNLPIAPPEPTRTSQPTETRAPTQISVSATQTSAPPAPALGIGSTMISDKDGMTLLYVPAGEFIMGSNETFYDEEMPAHTVYLDAYWIDQIEVTNSMYAKCVQAGQCNPPSSIKSSTADIYYGIPYYGDYPVIYVSWNDANNYCSWADRRLPTEAEWEKAASWDDETKTKYIYPWGNSSSCSFANYIGREVTGNPLVSMTTCVGDTTKVGTYESGKSPYGVYDMVGNVQEWVADSFELYPGGHVREGTSPQETDRIARGGSWNRGYSNAIGRHWTDPATTTEELGFRCALGANP